MSYTDIFGRFISNLDDNASVISRSLPSESINQAWAFLANSGQSFTIKIYEHNDSVDTYIPNNADLVFSQSYTGNADIILTYSFVNRYIEYIPETPHNHQLVIDYFRDPGEDISYNLQLNTFYVSTVDRTVFLEVNFTISESAVFGVTVCGKDFVTFPMLGIFVDLSNMVIKTTPIVSTHGGGGEDIRGL